MGAWLLLVSESKLSPQDAGSGKASLVLAVVSRNGIPTETRKTAV